MREDRARIRSGRTSMVKPAVIGLDGRTTAIRAALAKSPLVTGDVPRLSDGKKLLFDRAVFDKLLRDAADYGPDFVFVGPEQPLAAGVVDELSKRGIPCIGPTSSLARVESSKAFTRDLMARRNIPGSPEHRVFKSLDGLEPYLKSLDGFVVKPDGLTGGKGVKVSGTHLKSISEALEYARTLFEIHKGDPVIVEEKLDGEEFSLQSFCDGSHIVHMPVVQDHKRAWENDEGPNTGGMGSYSCPDHRLPFLPEADVRAAGAINAAVARALLDETGEKYKGILYGGFMSTRDGVRLLEYNARFGDPEALNVLPLLKTDFADVCMAILDERLDQVGVEFEPLATVCKYVVPEGYPDHPVTDVPINLDKVPDESERLRRFVAALEEKDGGWYLTGSRAIAFVGIGPTLAAAEETAEAAARAVEGPVYHRRDIGTRRLVERRVSHMRQLFRR